jgi:hypothetical protein
VNQRCCIVDVLSLSKKGSLAGIHLPAPRMRHFITIVFATFLCRSLPALPATVCLEAMTHSLDRVAQRIEWQVSRHVTQVRTNRSPRFRTHVHRSRARGELQVYDLLRFSKRGTSVMYQYSLQMRRKQCQSILDSASPFTSKYTRTNIAPSLIISLLYTSSAYLRMVLAMKACRPSAHNVASAIEDLVLKRSDSRIREIVAVFVRLPHLQDDVLVVGAGEIDV